MCKGLTADNARVHIYDPKVTEAQIHNDLSLGKFMWDHPAANGVKSPRQDDVVVFSNAYEARPSRTPQNPELALHARAPGCRCLVLRGPGCMHAARPALPLFPLPALKPPPAPSSYSAVHASIAAQQPAQHGSAVVLAATARIASLPCLDKVPALQSYMLTTSQTAAQEPSCIIVQVVLEGTARCS